MFSDVCFLVLKFYITFFFSLIFPVVVQRPFRLRMDRLKYHHLNSGKCFDSIYNIILSVFFLDIHFHTNSMIHTDLILENQ